MRWFAHTARNKNTSRVRAAAPTSLFRRMNPRNRPAWLRSVGSSRSRLPSTVGVGTRITAHPLHRSGRADFPHPALASGTDAKNDAGDTDDRRERAATSGRYAVASAPRRGEGAGSDAEACGIIAMLLFCVPRGNELSDSTPARVGVEA